jgi:hypothetical protein
LFNTDVVEHDVADKIIVAAVDGQTALVIYLRLCLSENVDVLVAQVLYGVATLRVAVKSDEDGCATSAQSVELRMVTLRVEPLKPLGGA